MDITWGTTKGNSLEANFLYQLLSLRNDVFIVEQRCPYQDIDGLDLLENTLHVWGKTEGKIVAYARILNFNSATEATRIGRVLTNSLFRGQQLGNILLSKTMDYILAQPNKPLIKLSAQAHLTKFYAAFGFSCVSAEYLEDDIPHIDMERQIT